MFRHPIRIAVSLIVITLALGLTVGSAQEGSAARSVPLQNLGWAPGFDGGGGSVTYEGVNDPFQATVNVEGLLPNHEYAVIVQGIAVDGTATTDDSSFTITTDGDGTGSTEVSLDLPTDEGLPVPAYQVHVLIVDTSQPLEEPLPNPLGVPFAIPLACEFPLGFRVGEAGSALPVEADTTIALANFGWAPEFEGGVGSFTWTPVGEGFEADVTATGLLPDHDYKLYVLAAAVDGSTTLDSTSYPVTTDGDGVASAQVSLTPPTEGLPVPAFQVHILVVDETVTLEEPLPNPLGIPHPIALACEFPAGLLALAPAPPALPVTGGEPLDASGQGAPPWTVWLVLGVGVMVLGSALGVVALRR